METLVVVAQQRNQYYNSIGKMDNFVGFRDISCRTFEFGVGLFPTPVSDRVYRGGKSRVEDVKSPKKYVKSSSIGVNLKGSGEKGRSRDGFSLDELWTGPTYSNSPPFRGGKSRVVDVESPKKYVKSSPIAMNLKESGKKERSRDAFSLDELWAGPAYSNSPPPSSLPIPMFTVKPKRTVSLELPKFESGLGLERMAKSAPASPTRESVGSSVSSLFDDDFATRSLRRILNLDIADD